MRVAVSAATALWLTPVIATGLYALGLPARIAVAVALLLGTTVGWVTSPHLCDTLRPAVSSRPLILSTAAFAVLAIVQIARVSLFMGDVTRVEFSYLASDPWRTQHCCLTAYAEAAQFAAERTRNIYDAPLYEPRKLHTLKVDPYHYPPPFLLLPRALQAVTRDFLQVRAVWFSMQALVLAGIAFGLAWWIGGRLGAYALIGSVFLLATPQALFSLQQGNFQSTAVPVGVAAFVLLCTNRVRTGAPLLAYVSASKIFPGVLLLYLIAGRRWRAVAWTVGAGVALVALTVVLFGTRPFFDFLRDEVPRISNGQGFPQAERPETAPQNQSVYGLTVRLRLLGVRSLNPGAGHTIASFYGFFILALSAFLGATQRLAISKPSDRLQIVQVALALVLLGSFRSPFVGFYGLLGFVWLMTLLAAESRTARALMLSLAAIAMFSAAHVSIPSPGQGPTNWSIAASAANFSVALVVSFWAVARTVRAERIASESIAVSARPVG